MKLYIKTIAAITVLLFFSIGMKADPTINIIKMLNGSVATETTATGDISTQIANGKCTLTVTPANGNYITAEKITYIKTINGSHAQTRTPDLDNEPIAVTALTPNADPSGETTYEFAIEDVYDYEITADFQSRKSIESAVITLANSSYTYTGEAHEPTVTVKLGETTLKLDVDFSVAYQNNKNAGEGTITVTGHRTYTGTKVASFTITKATISPKVTLAGWTYGATANKPSVSGNTGNGEVTYAYKMQNEAESAFADTVPTNAGAYTVKASIAATANYEAASDTAQFIIAKATPTLSFSAETASLTMDEEVTGLPTLSNPSGLAVTYTSSNSEVAKISEDGIVTPVAPGETTISATIATSNNYEGISASYVLTVNKSKRYGLKVGDTEVTEDNKNDILGDGDLDANKRPTFLFNPTDTTLLVINSEEGLTIESRLPELKIHLTGEKNKLKSIIFNNQDNTENIGKLIFTSDDAFPGKVTIANTAGESAIRGFESISFAEICKLLILSPEEAVYQNGTIGADTVIIGQLINPMTNGTTVTFNNDDFTVINPDGTQEEADLSSYTSNEIHYTLPGTTDGQGYDASTNTITVIDAMNDEEVQKIAKAAKDNTTTVGSGEYAQQFIGLTFMVAGGEGDIEIDQEVIPGYAFHLKIGEDTPKALGEGVAGRLLAKEHYKVDAATYCWLYLVENAVAASRAVARKWGDTRVGKRDRMHGAIYSVSVKPNKVKSANPPSQASGGVIPAAEGDEVETEGIQGVKVVNTVDNRWFTIDGRQIDKPTQKGLYIHNRKKVVVK